MNNFEIDSMKDLETKLEKIYHKTSLILLNSE